jgi:DeoR/GlpR family transcriptional regulator of sugar metabolism
MSKKSKKWPELGIITKNTVKDKDGNVLKDKSGNPITRLGFALAKNVTVLVDGEKVDTTGYGILTTPIDEVASLIKNGAIPENEVEERKEKAKEVHTWLRYKIQLPPPKVVQE